MSSGSRTLRRPPRSGVRRAKFRSLAWGARPASDTMRRRSSVPSSRSSPRRVARTVGPMPGTALKRRACAARRLLDEPRDGAVELGDLASEESDHRLALQSDLVLARMNDQAWVEQKNGAIVRRLVVYGRFEGPGSVAPLTRLSAAARLHTNPFQPSFKLREKARVGARVNKRWRAPDTGCKGTGLRPPRCRQRRPSR